MATAAQVIANRANAAHSTGPRSHEGKARCSTNAIRHGLTAANVVVREPEREAFESLRAGLFAELAPTGATETVVFDDLLHAAWNLERFRRLEAERAGDLDDPETAAFLDRLARYQSRAQRAFYRALRELRILQTNRALRKFKIAEEDEPEVPAITDINELTKQTHSEVQAEAMDMAIKMIDYEGAQLRLAYRNKVRADRDAAGPKSEPLPNPALRL